MTVVKVTFDDAIHKRCASRIDWSHGAGISDLPGETSSPTQVGFCEVGMGSFSQMAHDWANFFSALAQVSGALLGLVFVALTFKPKALAGGGDPLMGALARQTFADFLLLLLVSMLMLTPHFSAAEMGEGLLILVALDVARILRDLLRLHQHLARWRIVQRFVFSLLGHVLLGAAGVALMRGAIGPTVTGTLLLLGVMLLLLAGCRSAWLLIVHEQT